MSVEYSEDHLIQKTTADYFSESLKWESVYVYNDEVLGEEGTLGRGSGGLRVSPQNSKIRG